MKKLISIILIFVLLLPNAVYANDKQILSEKLSSIWLSPTENADVLENIYKSNNVSIEESINRYLITPGYYRKKVGISENDEEMIEQVKEMYSVKENEILKIYYLKNATYSKKYADEGVFKYLMSDDNYWFMKINETYNRYEMTGEMYDYKKNDFSSFGFETITNKEVEILQNNDILLDIFKNIDISLINDVKLFALNRVCTCLYVNCGNDEYIMCLYMGKVYTDNLGVSTSQNWIKSLEPHKLYNAQEFMQIISDEAKVLNTEKPTFEAEALSLQQDGLLHGNENGLDLLKPLTRIEAATMLLRVLGESTESAVQAQTFSDVPTSHWGYGAAENAYNLGLIKGIGDNLFAPDEAVTGTQFATMILRAANHAEFNWEEALDILINENIISAENASTMDFFTRGDMAKIIYEAREKNLLK